MENTRRSFLKTVSAAGLSVAGLAVSNNVAAANAVTATSAEKKKTAGKDDGKTG